MKNVIEFVRHRTPVEELRLEFNFTRVQFADAIDVAPATVEAWESGRRQCARGIDDMRAMLNARKDGISSSQNLIFGKYRFSLAKELLELSITECAKKYGVSLNYWLECEKNKRRVKSTILQKIEEEIRGQFACSF